MANDGEWEQVDSPNIERPPLRHIDKYVRPEFPCCDLSKRFTVALLASIGKVRDGCLSSLCCRFPLIA